MEQIPDSSISILLIFPAINTDSENDSSSEFNETSPRFSHNSNSVESLFPPARSAPDSPENYEIRITSFPIPEIFPPTISETETNDSCSESNQLPRAQFSFSSLFPPAGSETDSSSSKNDEIILDQILPTPNLRIFSSTELKVATGNFSPNTRLGNGNFGQVFKCWVEDEGMEQIPDSSISILSIFPAINTDSENDSSSEFNETSPRFSHNSNSVESLFPPARSATDSPENRMVIAVRKLSTKCFERFQGWQSLVNFLGGLSHPNIIKLLGYCWEDRELLLIYEFMQKGSLADHLLGRSAIQPLPWDLRLKIAIDAARGLAFLRTCDEQIIFEDFKASNILLDESYTAKILIKWGPSATESLETELECYYAPWNRDTVKQNFKRQIVMSDEVYGFGVVLVQILTGLRAFDTNRPSGKHYLVDWIKPYLLTKGKLREIMDHRLEGKYPSKAAFHISQLALECLEAAPKLRPSMKEVLEKLEQIEAANERPREPRNHASHPVVHRIRPQPLHHSPLHPRLDGNPANQNSSRVR